VLEFNLGLTEMMLFAPESSFQKTEAAGRLINSDCDAGATGVRSSLFCRLLSGGRVRNELLAVAGADCSLVIFGEGFG
jgi:hypothetical protein